MQRARTSASRSPRETHEVANQATAVGAGLRRIARQKDPLVALIDAIHTTAMGGSTSEMIRLTENWERYVGGVPTALELNHVLVRAKSGTGHGSRSASL